MPISNRLRSRRQNVVRSGVGPGLQNPRIHPNGESHKVQRYAGIKLTHSPGKPPVGGARGMAAGIAKSVGRYLLRKKRWFATFATSDESDPYKNLDLATLGPEWMEKVGIPVKIAAVKELHQSGKTHMHCYCEAESLVQKKITTELKGKRFNISERKKGPENKIDIFKYLLKTGNPIHSTIGDIKEFVESRLKKKSTSTAVILTNGILEGMTDSQLTLNYPSAIFSAGDKVARFRRRLQEANVKAKNPGICPEMEGGDPWEATAVMFLNDVIRQRRIKGTMIMYLWSKTKSAQKSTFGRVVGDVVNSIPYELCLSDGRWQECHPGESLRLLVIDALQTPAIPFRMIEVLGDGGIWAFPRRNCAPQMWGGPVLITSNRHFTELGYVTKSGNPYDMEIWEKRILELRIERPMGKLCEHIAKHYNLDYSKYFDDKESKLNKKRKTLPTYNGGFGGF